MRAQDDRVILRIITFYIERVLHFPSRMMRREVKELEVHFICFHVAGEIDLEAHLSENTVDLAQSLGGQVKSPANNGPTRQGDIQAFCLQGLKQTGLVQSVFPL